MVPLPATAKQKDLLPGAAGPRASAPVPRTNAQHQVQKVRRAASIRDTIDSVLLIAVDVFFFLWPEAHIPFLSRASSVLVLILANVLLVGFWVVTRSIPRWRARRIAKSWDSEERSKFGSR